MASDRQALASNRQAVVKGSGSAAGSCDKNGRGKQLGSDSEAVVKHAESVYAGEFAAFGCGEFATSRLRRICDKYGRGELEIKSLKSRT